MFREIAGDFAERSVQTSGYPGRLREIYRVRSHIVPVKSDAGNKFTASDIENSKRDSVERRARDFEPQIIRIVRFV